MCSPKYWRNKSSDKTFFHKITQYRKIKISCTLGVRIRLPQFRSAWILKPICNLSFDLCFTSKNFKTVLTYSVTRLCTFQFFLEWLYSKNYVICKKYYSSVKLHFWKFKVIYKSLSANNKVNIFKLNKSNNDIFKVRKASNLVVVIISLLNELTYTKIGCDDLARNPIEGHTVSPHSIFTLNICNVWLVMNRKNERW